MTGLVAEAAAHASTLPRRGELDAPHAYLSAACLHGQHELCDRYGPRRCVHCLTVCICPTCQHSPGQVINVGREAFHAGLRTNLGRVARLHILALPQDRMPTARNPRAKTGPQGLCGTSAAGTQRTGPTVRMPMPDSPPAGLTWCPLCLGRLADIVGVTGAFGAILAATVGGPR